jgi:hypothetical protein
VAKDLAPVEIERSTDFATYILTALNDFPIAPSVEDALNMVLANTSPDRLCRLAVFANSTGAGARYAASLAQLQAEIRSLPPGTTADTEPDATDDGPHSS